MYFRQKENINLKNSSYGQEKFLQSVAGSGLGLMGIPVLQKIYGVRFAHFTVSGCVLKIN